MTTPPQGFGECEECGLEVDTHLYYFGRDWYEHMCEECAASFGDGVERVTTEGDQCQS